MGEGNVLVIPGMQVAGISTGRKLGKDAAGSVSGRVTFEGNALSIPLKSLVQAQKNGSLLRLTCEVEQPVFEPIARTEDTGDE